jgi:hypothetical protein
MHQNELIAEPEDLTDQTPFLSEHYQNSNEVL